MKSTTKTFIFTALAYIIPTMILGLVWHFNFFPKIYDELGIYNRKEPIIPLGFTSMIIQGIILAYLFPYFSKEDKSIKRALKYSLIMGLFLFSVSTLANGAKIEVSSMQTWLTIQAAFHLIQFSVTGILIGLVNKQRN